jgi:hypothetical protein
VGENHGIGVPAGDILSYILFLLQENKTFAHNVSPGLTLTKEEEPTGRLIAEYLASSIKEKEQSKGENKEHR